MRRKRAIPIHKWIGGACSATQKQTSPQFISSIEWRGPTQTIQLELMNLRNIITRKKEKEIYEINWISLLRQPIQQSKINSIHLFLMGWMDWFACWRALPPQRNSPAIQNQNNFDLLNLLLFHWLPSPNQSHQSTNPFHINSQSEIDLIDWKRKENNWRRKFFVFSLVKAAATQKESKLSFCGACSATQRKDERTNRLFLWAGAQPNPKERTNWREDAVIKVNNLWIHE